MVQFICLKKQMVTGNPHGGDYQQLSNITVPDRYPIPHIQDFSCILGGKTIFTTIDLEKSTHHVPIAPEDTKRGAVRSL